MSAARFGDAHHQLPGRCWLAAPVLSPRYWTRFPQSQYEGLVGDLMGRGTPVHGHPASCATPDCDHAQIWHRHRTRTKPCQAPGCECLGFIQVPQDGFAWAVAPKAGNCRLQVFLLNWFLQGSDNQEARWIRTAGTGWRRR